jgi:D-alanyl-D-alanine carboxypeptidase
MSLITFFTVTIAFLVNALFGIQQEVIKSIKTGSVTPLRTVALPLGLSLTPIKKTGVQDPAIQAKAAITIDRDSGEVLYQKNASATLEPASITKLMTALVVMDNVQLSDVVTVSSQAVSVSGSKMHLIAGEKMTVGNLMKGMLIASANDAADALAIYVAGSINQFANLMNQKAQFLNLSNSHFTNPDGLSDGNHKSCAFDIAYIAKEALSNSTLESIMNTKTATVYDVSGKISHQLENTNKLIGQYGNIIGGKTGTLSSGESLVTAARGESDQIVIAVILDSPDRFGEMSSLLDWALKSYIWIGRL